MNIPLFFGTFFSLFSVILGAYFSHGLSSVDEAAMSSLQVALDYKRWHGLVLVVLGLSLYVLPQIQMKRSVKRVGWIFILAILLFSGSIYLSVLLNMPALTQITPIGGIAFMLAWFMLMMQTFKYKIY